MAEYTGHRFPALKFAFLLDDLGITSSKSHGITLRPFVSGYSDSAFFNSMQM